MIQADKVEEVRIALDELRRGGKGVGFVPTMGYLHDGHLALIRRAKELAEIVAVSIFVNPIQFLPSDDFDNYPRDIYRDNDLLEREKVDLLFFPNAEALYRKDFCTYIEVRGLSDALCGKSRRGHFTGVATIVSKLFNIIRPDVAVFGAKDGQQVLVIKRMVRDLDLGIEIEVVETVREADGLALSSRNKYLSPSERSAASAIPEALFEARSRIVDGEEISIIKSGIMNRIARSGLRVEYVCLVDQDTLEDAVKPAGRMMLAVAAWAGETRLIDNVMIEMKR